MTQPSVLWSLAALLTLSLAAASTSRASDTNGKFTIIGHGAASCGTVVSAFERNGAEKLAHITWVNGYLTAINEQVYSGKDVAEGTDVEARARWIYNYCKERPLEVLHSATQGLVHELIRRARR